MLPIETLMNIANPIPYAQNGMNQMTDTLGQASNYATNIKNSVGGAVVGMSKKVLDGEQSFINGLLTIPNMVLDFKQKGVDILQSILGIPSQQSNNMASSSSTANNSPSTAANPKMTVEQALMINELIKNYKNQAAAQHNDNGNSRLPQMQQPNVQMPQQVPRNYQYQLPQTQNARKNMGYRPNPINSQQPIVPYGMFGNNAQQP